MTYIILCLFFFSFSCGFYDVQTCDQFGFLCRICFFCLFVLFWCCSFNFSCQRTRITIGNTYTFRSDTLPITASSPQERSVALYRSQSISCCWTLWWPRLSSHLPMAQTPERADSNWTAAPPLRHQFLGRPLFALPSPSFSKRCERLLH